MTLLTNTAESIPAGAAVTVANSASPDAFTEVTIPAGSSITADAAAGLKGSRGFLFTSAASGTLHLTWGNVAGASNAAAFRLYMRLTALPATGERIAGFRSAGGGTGLGFLRVTTTGQLAVGSDVSASVAGTTTGTLSLNTIYRVELAVTNPTTTTGTATLRVYTGDSATPLAGLSLDLTALDFGTSTIGTIRIGRETAPGAEFTWHGDSLAFQTGSSAFIGPDLPNAAPTANAGPDQANVEPWATVTLTGSDSDSDGTIASRSWAQTGGTPTVTLAGTGAARTFEAPGTIAGTTLTFSYAATDNGGATTTDTVAVAVLPVTERAVIGGVEVPMRVRATQA